MIEPTSNEIDSSVDLLRVQNVSCHYGAERAVTDISLNVEKGKQVCLLGPSGCGKTTILRAIAGFHRVSSGSIHIGGRKASTPNMNIRPETRRVGMVFQDHALFPHMTVAENIGAGLRQVRPYERQRDIAKLLELMDIENEAKRYPHELSGGQQQRVALARALAPKPLLLLMDEPFSNLDLDLRERMGQDISDILKANSITCVMVTHDQNDAFALGDEVGVISGGSIVQWDRPYNLYHEPVNRFVADFIGNGVFISGEIVTGRKVQTALGVLAPPDQFQWPIGTQVDLLLRPDDLVHDTEGDIETTVLRRAFKGAEILYTLRMKQEILLLALFPSHTNFDIGEKVRVRLQVDHIVAFPRTE